MCAIHQDHGDQIQAKRAEIVSYWERLTAKAKVNINPKFSKWVHIYATHIVLIWFLMILQDRRQKLDESYYLHRFLADFRDLISWVNDMKAIISADELAKDVAGAEALLERHQEHKVRKEEASL